MRLQHHKKHHWISTVRLYGKLRLATPRRLLVATYNDPRPYETMVFPNGSWTDLYCRRYGNPMAAWYEHHRLAQRMSNGDIPRDR